MESRWYRFAALLAFCALVASCGPDEEPEPVEIDPPPPQEPVEPVETPPEPEEPEEPEEETVRPLYTVQVGSFHSGDAAQRLAQRLTRRDIPLWLAEAKVGSENFNRVRVGALPGLSEARRLGDKLASEFGVPIWVAPVDAHDRVPAGTITSTRAFLGR